MEDDDGPGSVKLHVWTSTLSGHLAYQNIERCYFRIDIYIGGSNISHDQ